MGVHPPVATREVICHVFSYDSSVHSNSVRIICQGAANRNSDESVDKLVNTRKREEKGWKFSRTNVEADMNQLNFETETQLSKLPFLYEIFDGKKL